MWAWPTTYATNNYWCPFSRAACTFTVSDQLRPVNEGGFYLRAASIRRNAVLYFANYVKTSNEICKNYILKENDFPADIHSLMFSHLPHWFH